MYMEATHQLASGHGHDPETANRVAASVCCRGATSAGSCQQHQEGHQDDSCLQSLSVEQGESCIKLLTHLLSQVTRAASHGHAPCLLQNHLPPAYVTYKPLPSIWMSLDVTQVCPKAIWHKSRPESAGVQAGRSQPKPRHRRNVGLQTLCGVLPTYQHREPDQAWTHNVRSSNVA